MKKRIKAICFDFGGVIFPDLHLPVVGQIAKRLGITSGRALEIYDLVEQKFQIGEAPFKDLWPALLKEAKNKIPLQEMEAFLKSQLVPDFQVVAIVKKLAKKYPLVIVSNTVKELLDYELDHYDLRQYFPITCTSFEAGFRKPAPEFFDYLLEKLPCRSNEVAFIDDRESKTQAAAEYGFQTIVFKNAADLGRQLVKLGALDD